MLFEKIPSPQALQMLNSATIYSAEVAEKLGFVQKIVPTNETHTLHESLVQSSRVLRSYKQALVSKWEQTNLKERMLAEIEQCAYLWEQDEHHIAVARFLQSKKK
jgi:enoyl-CoA hydratase/carnithine racemase